MTQVRPLSLMLAVKFGTSDVNDGLFDTTTSISPTQDPIQKPVLSSAAPAGCAGASARPRIIAVTSGSSHLRMSSHPPAHRLAQVRPPSAEHCRPPDAGAARMAPLGRTVTERTPP